MDSLTITIAVHDWRAITDHDKRAHKLATVMRHASAAIEQAAELGKQPIAISIAASASLNGEIIPGLAL